MKQYTDEQIKTFASEWGQTDDEISANLGFDKDDGGFDELMINLGYIWIPKYLVWVSKNCSFYTADDDDIIHFLTDKQFV